MKSNNSPITIKHTAFEDLFGIFSGSILISLGITLMHASDILTGGTAGLALMVAKISHLQVGTLYTLINLPFMILSIWKKGWQFTIRTLCTLIFVSLLVNYMMEIFQIQIVNGFLSMVIANVLLGVGMLVIFRHYSSLGGFNIVALIAQEKLGWKAGYVQSVMDAIVLAIGLTTYSLYLIVISIIGTLLINISLAMNYRSDRYLGYSNKR